MGFEDTPIMLDPIVIYSSDVGAFVDTFGISSVESAQSAVDNFDTLWNCQGHLWNQEGGRQSMEQAAKDTLQRFKEEEGEKKRGTAQHIGNKTSNWRAVATLPDYCKVGDSTVGFDSSANLEKKVVASPDVKAQSESKPVYRVGDLFRNIDGDAGSHVTSGTSQGSGHVRINSGQDNVKVNGKPVAKDGSFCQVNCNSAGEGGTVGKLVSERKEVDSSFQGGGGQSKGNGASGFWGKGASGSWDTPTLGDRLLGNVSKAGEFVQEKGQQFGTEAWSKTKEIGQSIADTSSLVWSALGTSPEAQAAQAQIGNSVMGAMEGMGTLMGPSPEMVQAAYSPWGTSEMRELVEQMQHNQQVAGKAVVDSIAQDVSATYQRSGVAGVAGRAFPTVVEAVVGSKGTVAVAKVAGEVSSIANGVFKAGERVAELTKQAKNADHLVEMLDKEIALARSKNIPKSELDKLEEARAEAIEKARQHRNQSNSGVHVKAVPEWKGPTDYKDINVDRFKIKEGANFTSAQKKAIYERNKLHNDGILRSDKDGSELVPSMKSERGVTPPQNEAQVDHVYPRSKGGTNDPRTNAQILSREQNRAKSDK